MSINLQTRPYAPGTLPKDLAGLVAFKAVARA
jgi:hypothetical protein